MNETITAPIAHALVQQSAYHPSEPSDLLAYNSVNKCCATPVHTSGVVSASSYGATTVGTINKASMTPTVLALVLMQQSTSQLWTF